MLLSALSLVLLPSVISANPLLRKSSSCTAGTQIINGRQCTVQCGTDYPGGDYKTLQASSFQDCINLCAADSVCTDAQYCTETGSCSLKKTLTSSKASSSLDSVVCEPCQSTTTGATACSSLCGTVSTPTTTVTTTKITTVSGSTLTTTTSTTVTASPVTSTVTSTTTETTSVLTTVTTTSETIYTSTSSSVTTTTSYLTCLNSAYKAAEHPVTIGGAQKIKKRQSTVSSAPASVQTTLVTTTKATVTTSITTTATKPTTSTCQCPTAPAVTRTVTSTSTITGTVTVYTATNTVTYTPTTTTTSYVTAIVTSSSTLTSTFTSTSTTVSTTLITATATAIRASGLHYRRYYNRFDDVNAPKDFSANEFKSASALSEALRSDANFQPEAQSAYLLQGFFLGPQNGMYKMSSGQDAKVDNWNYLWIGDKAYKTWTDSNTDYKAFGYLGQSPTEQSGSFSFILSAGDAIPMTLLAANGKGPGLSQYSVTLPNGTPYNSNLRDFWVPACNRASTFT